MNTLKAGDNAPEFVLLDQNGLKTSLADIPGKRALIYFYPKAMTPGWYRSGLFLACGEKNLLWEKRTRGSIELAF